MKKFLFLFSAIILLGLLSMTLNKTGFEKKITYIENNLKTDNVSNLWLINDEKLNFDEHNYYFNHTKFISYFIDKWQNSSLDGIGSLSQQINIHLDNTIEFPNNDDNDLIEFKGFPASYSSIIIYQDELGQFVKIEQLFFRDRYISYSIYLNSYGKTEKELEASETLISLMEKYLVKVNINKK